ncbi:MAG: hypothetical protein AVO34_02190 [Firmicutes bacterium ML8_F2]|jgi:O-antigen ligase|nr:MAG: hypothetical protein AVO34_02190 [Firmicutes bacterium ML8_F2]
MSLKENSKNLIILLTEIAVIFLMVFKVAPLEASLFLTGLMVFYFIFSKVEDSLWVFIASIPLFVALPITESFDSMANWRILLTVLLLVIFFKHGLSIKLTKGRFGKWKIKEKFRHSQMEYLTGIFFLIGVISLIAADNLFIGIKKILFIVNILFLFIIIRNLAYRNKKVISKIISALKTAIGITLGVGFLQLAMVFFINLHQFWYLWDRNVINVFYGQELSNLLSYTNTWFSYYSYQLPTLRMFSVFPDSHSFAFFCILSLPFILTAVFKRPRGNKKKAIIFYLLLISCLSAIIFSGSRGAWASALISLSAYLFIIFFYWSPSIRSRTTFFTAGFNQERRRQTQLIIGSLVIFFLLMPIASAILFAPQYLELGRDAMADMSFFERARSMIDFLEISVKSRLEIWQRTADSIIMKPLLGVGIGNYSLVLNEDVSFAKKGSSAHSLYLDIAAEMGIFALIVLTVIFWQILKEAWKQKSSCWTGFLVLALVWIFSYSLFDVVLFNDKVFLFFVAIIGLLYASPISFNKSPDS